MPTIHIQFPLRSTTVQQLQIAQMLKDRKILQDVF